MKGKEYILKQPQTYSNTKIRNTTDISSERLEVRRQSAGREERKLLA